MARTNIVRGIEGRVTFGATNIHAEQYRLTAVTDDIPAISFEDSGTDPISGRQVVYDDGDTGVLYHTLSFSGYWNASQNPHGNPPNLRVGLLTAAMSLYVNKTTATAYTCPQTRVLQTETSTQLRGRVDLSVVVKTNGPVTYPT